MRNQDNWVFGFSATCFMTYVILISLVQNLIYDSIMYSTIMLMLAIMHRKSVLSSCCDQCAASDSAASTGHHYGDLHPQPGVAGIFFSLRTSRLRPISHTKYGAMTR